jgi:hypothetical protein
VKEGERESGSLDSEDTHPTRTQAATNLALFTCSDCGWTEPCLCEEDM